MELGERLRQARLEAGLSQRQLCREEITRNMLSQIENGSARPSMDTLRTLASRLGKPVSFFLEEPTVDSPNQAVMARARQAYIAGDAGACVQALEGYQEPDAVFDNERWLLEAMARMALAREALANGKPAYALALLERAAEAGDRTVYDSQGLKRQRLLLRFGAEPEAAEDLAKALPDNAQELMLRAAAALAAGDPAQTAVLLEAVQGTRDARWYLLRGEGCYALEDYAAAIPHYLLAKGTYPRQVLPKLENCYLARRDFENAYRCATERRELGL